MKGLGSQKLLKPRSGCPKAVLGVESVKEGSRVEEQGCPGSGRGGERRIQPAQGRVGPEIPGA